MKAFHSMQSCKSVSVTGEGPCRMPSIVQRLLRNVGQKRVMSNLLSILFSPLTSARDFIYDLLLMHRNWFYICNHSPSILAVKYRNKICVGGYMGSSACGDGVVTTTYGKIWAEMFVSTVIKNWIVLLTLLISFRKVVFTC